MFDQEKGGCKQEVRQIIVPSQHRTRVMSLPYEAIVDHLSTRKTKDMIETNFYLPSITGDVKRF